MPQTTAGSIRVGGVTVPLGTALDWITAYTSEANRTTEHPYAYPAYDLYGGGNNDPVVLTDADLLAPVLLNVTPTLRAYYGLQRVRPDLEVALAHDGLAEPLVAMTDPERIAAAVSPLYAVLDDPDRRTAGVQGTTLSKILHRKRPQSIVLHDQWVRACYVGEGKPVPTAHRRTWGEYMTLLTIAIGRDLRTQAAAFAELDRATSSPGTLSHVRLLDIIAWTSQGRPLSEDEPGTVPALFTGHRPQI